MDGRRRGRRRGFFLLFSSLLLLGTLDCQTRALKKKIEKRGEGKGGVGVHVSLSARPRGRRPVGGLLRYGTYPRNFEMSEEGRPGLSVHFPRGSPIPHERNAQLSNAIQLMESPRRSVAAGTHRRGEMSPETQVTTCPLPFSVPCRASSDVLRVVMCRPRGREMTRGQTRRRGLLFTCQAAGRLETSCLFFFISIASLT